MKYLEKTDLIDNGEFILVDSVNIEDAIKWCASQIQGKADDENTPYIHKDFVIGVLRRGFKVILEKEDKHGKN